MLEGMTVRGENMRRAADGGYINATDCADYLAKKGLPFRDAYKVTGRLVAYAIKEGKTLAELSRRNTVCFRRCSARIYMPRRICTPAWRDAAPSAEPRPKA